MRKKTDFYSIHKVTMIDIKKNIFLICTMVFIFVIYFMMAFLGNAALEKTRWTAYAVFLYSSVLAIPLIYYIRYSDKNKRIISMVIHTKLPNVKLYHFLLGYYLVIIFSVEYGILMLITEMKYFGKVLDVYLFVSVICVLYIANMLCIWCLNIFSRYYIGLIVYITISVFFLSSNSVFFGFLSSFNYEIFGIKYFIGKMIELIIIGVGNIILVKKRLLY